MIYKKKNKLQKLKQTLEELETMEYKKINEVKKEEADKCKNLSTIDYLKLREFVISNKPKINKNGYL